MEPKKNLDPIQIVDSRQGMILLVEQLLQDLEFLKGTKCRNYKQLKAGFQKLLNLLRQAGTSSSAMKKCLAHLESLQAEFSVIDNDATGLYAKATRIIELLRTCIVYREEVMKSEAVQPYPFNTLDNEDYKQFYNFDHASISPTMLVTYPVGGGVHGNKRDKNNKNKDTKDPNGNKSKQPPPPADDDLATVGKNGPDDNDLPPSGEAIAESTNPVNPPLYHDPLAALEASTGNTLIHQQGPDLSYMNSREEARKQPPAVRQQSTVYSGGTVVQSVEATNYASTQNSAPFCSPNHANDGFIHEATFPDTNSITVATKEAIKDIQKQTELGSFPSEYGGFVSSRRQSNSLVPSGPLHPPVGPVTVNSTPASDNPGNVVAASTQQATTIFSYEELKLGPPDART